MEQLCEKMGSGIIVTDLEGVFAGVNTINGSFSLLSKGMLVENGKPVKPFCEVTIAGNIYTMLEEIETLGDDRSGQPVCADPFDFAQRFDRIGIVSRVNLCYTGDARKNRTETEK